jgi:hypothetical protein
MKGDMLMSSKGKILAGLLAVASLTIAAALPGAASAGVHLKNCGKVQRLGVEVEATKVSCRKAIRIVAAYKRSGVGRGFPKRVPGFPGWECSSGDRLGSCSRGSYAPSAPQIVFPYLQAPGERRLDGPTGIDRAAEPLANRSCGSVVVQGTITYKLTVEKGSPSCATVRKIAKKYGHPISKKPRFYCGHQAYECEYSIYPEGWRCGGLFQGNWQCWHGANSPARAEEVFDGSEDLSARPLMRKARDVFEFYAEDPHSRYKTQCAIYDGYAGLSEAFCSSYPPREGKATVNADGSVVLCRARKGAEDACLVGNAGERTPTLRYGRHVSVGRFRCTVLRSGVKCVVRATGKGFVFSSRRERAVGGATVERTGRRARMPVADRRLLASSVGIFSAKGSGGRLGACDMYIPESRERGVLCVSTIAGKPGHFREAKLLVGGQVSVCSDTTECGWVFDDPDPGPTFGPGHVVKDPPFRCKVLSRAIKCTLIGSRRGFLINTEEVRQIGPT